MSSLDDVFAELMSLGNISKADVEAAASGESPESEATEVDPTARLTVKPLRGGSPEAPLVKHAAWGECLGTKEQPWLCRCGPVRTEGHAERVAGIRVRGLGGNRPTMPRGELRSVQVQYPEVGARLDTYSHSEVSLYEGLKNPEELRLEPLPKLEPLPPVADYHTSAQPGRVTEVATHTLCKAEQNRLHTRAVRAEYKLTRAQAEIERLKAELAKLQAPARPKKGQTKKGK